MSVPSLLRTILLPSASLLLLSSCEMNGLMDVDPDSTSMVDGQVLYGNDVPVAGVEVILLETAVFDQWPKAIKTTRTDALGRFRIDFAHDGKHTYVAVVEGLYESSKESRASLRPGENQDIVLRYYRSP